MFKFTIDRKTWLRGDNSAYDGGLSSLYRRSDRKMCCVGKYLESCGVSKEDLLDKATANAVVQLVPDKAAWLLSRGYSGNSVVNSPLACKLYSINDYEKTSDTDKEVELKLEFGRIGIEVVFIN
jgi:hypothetical protein